MFQKGIRPITKYDYTQKLTCFYSLWTLKESFVKLVGTGLYYPINLVEFNLSDILKDIRYSSWKMGILILS
ncbi:4'-phosphopantetheinyl transferase superfamily protein [Bacillus wiedmannii]|uniref:4'-phosphopantetheinyl transferase superfamily protein n=1 Tax=Bacillus wiedmannii TaxID=1890302 RepID=UPI0032FC0050|nr:4'-phosphopantetheinyl transferase superfamily protein [Bacillus cereus]